MSRQHHIKRQLLDFEFGNKVNALKWQQKVPSHYLKEYEKVIEKVLDRYDDGRCQHIDKIVVDLGTASEAQIADLLSKALDEILNKMLLRNVQHYEIANIDPRTKTTIDVTSSSSKEELLSVFQYFVTRGNFPWNMAKTTIPELEERLKKEFEMTELASSLQFKKVLQGQRGRTRFYYQFGPEFVDEVYCVYFSKQYENLKRITDFCKKQFSKSSLTQHFKKANSSSVSHDILEWISLFAPEDNVYWSTAFIPWYIEKHWVSETPFSYISMWISADIDDKRESAYQFINLHLTKIFRHLDLHLSTISEEDVLKTTGTLDKDERLPKSDKISFDPKTISEPDSKIEGATTQEAQNKTPGEKRLGKSNKTKNNSLTSLPDKKGKNAIPNPEYKAKKDEEIDERPKASQKDAIEKDSQELEERIEDEEYPSEALSAQDMEASFEKENEPKVSGDTSKQVVSNDDEKIQFDPDVSQTISGSKRKGDLIASKEFYKEVEEILDVQGSGEQGHWETGNAIQDSSVDSYYINDSGIVLVWPYLNRLFENLGYIREKQFVSKEIRERAILVLGYIATGKTSCEEHQLVFAKFLCGWPFHMPIKKSVKLTKKELKETNAMLTGLIGHWSVLKNTSISGLRETFFYRDGKLERQEEDWKLTVEQKGTDILLDRLPFGIAIIKLPWLKKILRVDWV